jgi:dolichol-phosphate mannosyltransferase
MPRLSIVLPAYNEAAFIGTLLQKLHGLPTEPVGYEKEIIVVDDGSNDDTAGIAGGFPGVRVIKQQNQGKGAAVQRGVRESTGEYVLVQDADLEYDPGDIITMLKALPSDGRASIYGSRVMGALKTNGWRWPFPGRHDGQDLGPWIANLILSIVTFGLYGHWISDMLTGYKLYPTAFLRTAAVKTKGFETDHELSAKLFRAGIPVVEVPVRYTPRTVSEGKKIRARDGFIALQTLFRFRFAD